MKGESGKVEQYGEGVEVDTAATILQRAFRAYQRRKVFKTQLTRHKAAQCIQAVW